MRASPASAGDARCCQSRCSLAISSREKTAGAGSGCRAVAESYLLGIFFELLRPRRARLRPPLTDPLVVSRDEDIGHSPASVGGRAGVVRVLRRSLEDPAERLLDGALLVPERPRQLPHQ